jgi:hypothetical protein
LFWLETFFARSCSVKGQLHTIWNFLAMAVLAPEFRHDLFISYARGDHDNAGNSLLSTWSLELARALHAELRTTPGQKDAAVFFDESDWQGRCLDSNSPLTAQLRDAAANSALLLLLMSPHYLASDWCGDERAWWYGQATAKDLPEIADRAIFARVWPTEDDPWPTEFCDERGHPPLGVWFHERPGDKLTTRPFGWPKPTSEASEFGDAVVELAGQISVRLRELNKALVRRREAEANAAKLRATHGQAIYVHARACDKARWENACNELLNAGYGIFPDAPEAIFDDPRLASKTEGEIVRMLSGCDGLLLVPGDDPRILVSDLAVVGHQRRNSARALKSKTLPCAVVDRGLMLEGKPRLQQSARNLRIDWINASIADWTSEVKNWLGAAGQSSAP